MPRFAVVTGPDELQATAATLTHLGRAFPSAPVTVVLAGFEHAHAVEVAPVMAGHWPDVTVQTATSHGRGRSAACAHRPDDGPVAFLHPGSTVDAAPEAFARAVDLPRAGAPAMRFAVAVADASPRRSDDFHWPSLGTARPVRLGRAGGRWALSPTALDRVGPADLGGPDCVVDPRRIGPGCALDWADVDDAIVATADLGARIADHPVLASDVHPDLRVRSGARLDVTPAARGPALAWFLRRHRLHTVDAHEPTSFLATRRRTPHGPPRRALKQAAGAVVAHWRDPGQLVRRWATLASRSAWDRHVRAAHPDALAANTVVARDARWAFVASSGVGADAVLRWLRANELGIDRPPPPGSAGFGRLMTGADLGAAELGELIRRPSTFVFTVVDDPAARLWHAWSDLGSRAPHHPPFEALRSWWADRQELPVDAPAPALDHATFLEAVAALPDHLRDRRWRRLTDALALDTLRYDAVLRTEELGTRLADLAPVLGLDRPRPFTPPEQPAPPPEGFDITAAAGADLALIRAEGDRWTA